MSEPPFPIGRRITLNGHFAEPVVLESVRALGDGCECRVRLADGSLEEVVLSHDETFALAGQPGSAPALGPADARDVQLLVESARIRLAYAHDRQFAVNLSGIRTLPHQIEAVYQKMLPQPCLRMLLADDPGAGKTIMTGLVEKRQYRNGVALAIPDKKPIEALRRAVRYLMAVERVESKKKQHRLTKEQDDQLKERRKTEEAAAETAFRQLYAAVWLPRVGQGGSLDLEKIDVGTRPLQATGVHERVMELLTVGGKPKIFGTLEPGKIVGRMRLGESLAEGEPPRLGVRTKDVVDAFFGFLEPPRISSDAVLAKAIAKGVGKATFAYTTGMPALGPDGKYQVALSKVAFDLIGNHQHGLPHLHHHP